MRMTAAWLVLCSLAFASCLHAQPSDVTPAAPSAFDTAQAAAEKAVAEKAAADSARITAEVGAFERIAQKAMETSAMSAANAASSVEVMKWIFGIASTFITIGGAFVYYLFGKKFDKLNDDQAVIVAEFRERMKRIEAEESARLAKLARIFTVMMTVERFMEDSNQQMVAAHKALAKLNAEADHTTADWKARHAKQKADFDTYFNHTQQDLLLLKKLDIERLDIAPEPRWTAYIAAQEGLLYYHGGNYKQAYDAFMLAISGTKGDDYASRSRRASYTYNASCGCATSGDLVRAKELLEACLKLEPRYFLDMRDDADWKAHLTDKDVIRMTADAALAYGPT